MEHNTINNMAVVRVISGLLEIGTALFFLKVGRVDTALRMNAFLGLLGPIIFIIVSALGITTIAVKLSWYKIGIIIVGLILVLLGTKN